MKRFFPKFVIWLAVLALYSAKPQIVSAHPSTNCAPGYCGPDPDFPAVRIDVFATCYVSDGNCIQETVWNRSWLCNNDANQCTGDADSGDWKRCVNNQCTSTLHYHCCVYEDADPTPTTPPGDPDPTPTTIPTPTSTPIPTPVPCIPGGSGQNCTLSPDNCCAGYACTPIPPFFVLRCATVPTPTMTPIPTLTPAPTPMDVSGRVHYDPNHDASPINKCTGPDSPIGPPNIGDNGSIKAYIGPDNKEGPILGGANLGKYTVSNIILGTKIISLQNLASTYQCTCPSDCQYDSANLEVYGTTDWNFYVTDILTSWWQVLWSDVHAQGGFTANVPEGENLLVDAPAPGGEPGVATANNKDNIAVNGGSLSSTGNKYDDGIGPANWRYSYQSLWQKAGRPTQTGNPGGWTGSGTPTADGVYMLDNDLTINSNWTIGDDLKITIFVNGDVNINDDVKMNDPDSGFLAIIANGDIVVDNSVKKSGDPLFASEMDGTDAQLAGAFWAGGNFTVDEDLTDDTDQLIIYGSIAGGINLVGGVIFDRNLGENNDKPPVAVIWNPFLVLNAPDELKDAYTDWREVAP